MQSKLQGGRGSFPEDQETVKSLVWLRGRGSRLFFPGSSWNISLMMQVAWQDSCLQVRNNNGNCSEITQHVFLGFWCLTGAILTFSSRSKITWDNLDSASMGQYRNYIQLSLLSVKGGKVTARSNSIFHQPCITYCLVEVLSLEKLYGHIMAALCLACFSTAFSQNRAECRYKTTQDCMELGEVKRKGFLTQEIYLCPYFQSCSCGKKYSIIFQINLNGQVGGLNIISIVYIHGSFLNSFPPFHIMPWYHVFIQFYLKVLMSGCQERQIYRSRNFHKDTRFAHFLSQALFLEMA